VAKKLTLFIILGKNQKKQKKILNVPSTDVAVMMRHQGNCGTAFVTREGRTKQRFRKKDKN
jgi:hypothetical protein